MDFLLLCRRVTGPLAVSAGISTGDDWIDGWNLFGDERGRVETM